MAIACHMCGLAAYDGLLMGRLEEEAEEEEERGLLRGGGMADVVFAAAASGWSTPLNAPRRNGHATEVWREVLGTAPDIFCRTTVEFGRFMSPFLSMTGVVSSTSKLATLR